MIPIRNRQCFAAVPKIATLASSPVKLTRFGGPLPTDSENEAVPMTRFHVLTLGCVLAAAVSFSVVERAQAEAKLLIDAGTGRVLYADNATQPWYPASVTKLMTLYTTLREVKLGHIGLDTLITMTPDAHAQQPTKMGFPVGTKITIDNALKMLMVKSANDIAVAIAEGIGGSIPGFADMMNENAQRLGMTQSNFVNPNGLPAENHVTSARDLGILARALIKDFPEYDSYLHVHAIKYGNRVMRNYNSLLDRYPGADGMKTGFICAAGYNLVASATRNGRRLIAVVLGAWGGGVRAQQAAELLERGFNSAQLSWLIPSLGTVDSLAPIDAPPPNLTDQMCGGHRRKPPSEENDEQQVQPSGENTSSAQAFMLSNLQPAGKFVLGPPVETEPPVVVYTGPAGHPDPIATASVEKKKKPKAVKQAANESDDEPAAKTKKSVKGDTAEPKAKPKAQKPAKQAKAKSSKAEQ
jgi:D-alanyl-D-alanine carboxypeptidase